MKCSLTARLQEFKTLAGAQRGRSPKEVAPRARKGRPGPPLPWSQDRSRLVDRELLRLWVQVAELHRSINRSSAEPEDVQPFADVRLVDEPVVPVGPPRPGDVAAERRRWRDRLRRRIAPRDRGRVGPVREIDDPRARLIRAR